MEVQRKRGKRGGTNTRSALRKLLQEEWDRKDIHSKVRGVRRLSDKGTTTTGILERGALTHRCSDLQETVKDHLIPRKSLTEKQLLMVFPRQVETEAIHGRQLDQLGNTGKFTTVDEALSKCRMIETTDQRQTWRSDKSLLLPGKPGQRIGTFKRDGFVKLGLDRRNTRRSENEDDTTVIDQVIDNAIPDTEIETI